MTTEDLLVLAPWLIFAAGLAAITWRLLAHRRPRRRRPDLPPALTAGAGGTAAPDDGRRHAGQAAIGQDADR